MARSHFADLGLRGRTYFAVSWVLVQAALVLSASLRPDLVFAFRMFNESSTISIALSRRLLGPDGTPMTVPTNGTWYAEDERGQVHSFRWRDRVKDPILATLGRPVQAAYGVDAQLFRLEQALSDVLAHDVGDTETRALIADVEVRRNGRAPFVQHLEAAR